MKAFPVLVPALMAVSLVRPASGASPPIQRMIMPATDLERISSGFGYRHDGFHPGVDLAAPYGSPVRAAVSGRVVYAGRNGEYGKVVDLRSSDGLVTRYAHLSRILHYVTQGRELDEGKTLGSIGMTGNASGPHLHFEVMVDRKPVDPVPYLASLWAVSASGSGPTKIAVALTSRGTLHKTQTHKHWKLAHRS